MTIKLVSLNIQADQHLLRVKKFLDTENADVVALMEVCENDIDKLLTKYPHRKFVPNFRFLDNRNVGVVLAARIPLGEVQVLYCDELNDNFVPPHGITVGIHRPVVVKAQVGNITLAATHFTWTPNMSETNKQKTHVHNMLDQLGEEEIVLCGDFNIPRGNSTYQLLAARYSDNIPPQVTTTIDPHLHRVNRETPGKLSVVVDYVWTTPTYRAEKVEIIDGVSDHCAVVAQLTKN